MHTLRTVFRKLNVKAFCQIQQISDFYEFIGEIGKNVYNMTIYKVSKKRI